MFKESYKHDDFDLMFIRYDRATLGEFKKLDIEFDSYLINRDAAYHSADNPLIDMLAIRTYDWIEVFGFNCEEIHDQLDTASVRGGRQHKEGDGSPMTAWHDDMDTPEMLDHVLTGGLSASETRIIILIGSQADETEFLESFRLARIAYELENDLEGD